MEPTSVSFGALHWEENKAWGRVCHLFYEDFAGLSYLEVNAGFRCSWHKHEHRVNHFFSISAKLVIEISTTSDPLARCSQITLLPNTGCAIPAGLFHRFRVLESGVVVELYTPSPVCITDIHRIDEGGVDNG